MNLLSIVRQIKATSAYPTYNPVFHRKQKTTANVSPIVVATDQRSINFVRKNSKNFRFCVIRARDFLKDDGRSFNRLYYKVKKAGGAAAYFGFDILIVLSFIMEDDLCFRITPEIASELIRGLRVNISTTFDTATYTNQRGMADLRMEQLLENNRCLVAENPDVLFLGVVKGGYPKQIEEHISELTSLGIEQFIFHTGDFLCRGSWAEKKIMRELAGITRRNVPFIYLYGAGSRRSFELLPYADGLITLNHIIETKNGIFTDGDGKAYQPGKFGKKRQDVQLTLSGDVISDSRDMLHEADLTFKRIVREFNAVHEEYEEIYQTDLSVWDTSVSISLDYATSCLHCQGCPAGWC